MVNTRLTQILESVLGKEKHRKSVSKSKSGGLNPNAKKCVFLKTGEIFNSGADMVRNFKLNMSAHCAVKCGVAKWL